MIIENYDIRRENECIKLFIEKEMTNRQVKACPICKGENYIKYGMYNGIQRYKCKGCGKTFSLTTNSVCKYSKKKIKLWIEFIELMLARKTLREAAEKLKINLGTAFYWRHKILNVLEGIYTPEKLKDDVHISKGVIKENFKGSRNIKTNIRKEILIFEAKGKADSILAMPVCKEIWNLKNFNTKVYSKIDKGAYIIPYGDRYLTAIARKHNINLLRKTDVEEGKVKYFRFYLKVWLVKFRGIATKYLKEYLSWFVLYNLDRLIDDICIITNLFSREKYIRGKDIRLVQKDL